MNSVEDTKKMESNEIDFNKKQKQEVELIGHLVNTFESNLISQGFNYFIIIQGKTGHVIGVNISDMSLSLALKAIFREKKYGFNFWKKLFLLFG